MATVLTRNKTTNKLFGSPSDLPPNQLPIIGDVLRQILKYKVEDEEAVVPKFGD